MKMKKTLMGVFVIILLVISLSFSSALTGSIGNAKVVLYPEVNGIFNTVIDRTINIKNVNEIPILVNLTLDSEGEKIIDLEEESFVLQPGEEKDAEFKIKVKKEGKYEGRINVFFSPESPEEGSGGVVLSSTVVVIASKDKGYEEEEEKIEEEKIDPITGEVIKDNNRNNTNSILFYLSVVLLLVLLFLLYLMGKKGKKPKNKVKKKK